MKLKKITSLLLSALLTVGSLPLTAPAVAADSAEPVTTVKLAQLTPVSTANTGNGYGVGTYDVLYNYSSYTGSGSVATFDNSIFLHATGYDGTLANCASVTYDISEYTTTDVTFTSKVGIRNTNGTQTNTSGAGSVRFYIGVDDNAYHYVTWTTVKPTSGLTTYSCNIPAGSKTLTLWVDSCDYTPPSSYNFSPSNDWSCFYVPTLTTDLYLTSLTGTEENGKGKGFGYGTFDAVYSGGATQTFDNSISFGIDSSSWDTSGPSVTYDVSAFTADGDRTFTSKTGFRYQWNGNTNDGNGAAFVKVYAIDAEGNSSNIGAAWNMAPSAALGTITATIPQGTQKLKLQASQYLNYNNIHLQWPSFLSPKIVGEPFASVSLTTDKTTVNKGETAHLTASVNGSSEGVTVSYESSDTGVATVSESGVVTAVDEGEVTVTARVVYKGVTFVRTVKLIVTTPSFELYLSDLTYSDASVGYGNLCLDKDSKGALIHFKYDSNGNALTCDKGIFAHAASYVEYDLSDIPAKAFRATVGINDTEGENGDGSVIFRVYADGVELFTSDALSKSSQAVDVNVVLPTGTQTLKLVSDSNGPIDSDHAAWGNARISVAEEDANKIVSLVLKADQVLSAGETTTIISDGKTLKGEALTDKAEFTYESLNTDVVTVQPNGTVTALKNGKATVNVTATTDADAKTVAMLFVVGSDEEANLYTVSSPDGTREAVLCLDDNGSLHYAVKVNGHTEIGLSDLGLDTTLADFTAGLTFDSASVQTTIDETYTISARIQSEYRNYANERSFTFLKDGAELTVTLRAYNDGVALRYTVDSKIGGSFTVNCENTSLLLPNNSTVWAMPYVSTHEGLIEEAAGSSMNGDYNMPLIIQNPATGSYVTVTEAVLNPQYPASKITANAGIFRVGMVGSATTATVASPFVSPWRLFVAGSLEEIAVSSMVTDVAPEADSSKDWSFAQGGVSTWSWLTSGSAGQENENVHKKYIDFTAEMGWTYYTMDDSWQIANGEGREAEYKEIIPNGEQYFDWTQDVINYANQKGVKVLVWVHKKNLEDPEKMNAMLESYASLGFAGIKVDFFNSERADTIALYNRIYEKCAELGLLVNCHGANKPTGEVRTYPNVMAREAVRGDEYWFMNPGMKASQFTVLPFTRGVTGPTDVTESLYPNGGNKATPGSQAALSVVMIAIGKALMSSLPFPPLHTVRATFTAHGVPSILLFRLYRIDFQSF